MTTNKLTQEEKRIKIAEACGWKHQHSEAKGEMRWYGPDGHNFLLPPDYFNDLNAMHEAEASLYEFFMLYIECLERLTFESSPHAVSWEDFKMKWVGGHVATAAHRAEAFGLTLGLWEAGQ